MRSVLTSKGIQLLVRFNALCSKMYIYFFLWEQLARGRREQQTLQLRVTLLDKKNFRYSVFKNLSLRSLIFYEILQWIVCDKTYRHS